MKNQITLANFWINKMECGKYAVTFVYNSGKEDFAEISDIALVEKCLSDGNVKDLNNLKKLCKM